MNEHTENNPKQNKSEVNVLILYRGRDNREDRDSRHSCLAPLIKRLEEDASSLKISVHTCREEDYPDRPINYEDLQACVGKAQII